MINYQFDKKVIVFADVSDFSVFTNGRRRILLTVGEGFLVILKLSGIFPCSSARIGLTSTR